MGAGDNEEDLLAVVDGDVKGLLVVLQVTASVMASLMARRGWD